jgi:hypothetical protein
MNLPYYVKYCVKCGEYNHLYTECKNIDETKICHIANNHQYKIISFIYDTIPAFCELKNERCEYQCRTCKRLFREYKYYIYHELYNCHTRLKKIHEVDVYSREFKNIVVLK